MKFTFRDKKTNSIVTNALVQIDNLFAWSHAYQGRLEVPNYRSRDFWQLEVEAEGFYSAAFLIDNSPYDQTIYLHKITDHLPPWWQQYCGITEDIISHEPFTIGIIDSGCGNHLCLEHVERYRVDFNEDGAIFRNEVGIDLVGHGTHVAGLIGARPKRNVKFSGCNPNVRLISIRVTDQMVTDDPKTLDKIVAALDFLATEGAGLINMSMYFQGEDGTRSRVLIDAIDEAMDQGVIIVAAAGNSGDQVLMFPASHNDVIAISSFGHVDHTLGDTISHHGNYRNIRNALSRGDNLFRGEKSNHDPKTFWFPGVSIVSTFPHSEPSSKAMGLKELDGTSMATAIASGYISKLIHSKSRPLDGTGGRTRIKEVQRMLDEEAQKVGNPSFRTICVL